MQRLEPESRNVTLRFPLHPRVEDGGGRVRAHGGDEQEAPDPGCLCRVCETHDVVVIDPGEGRLAPRLFDCCAEGAKSVLRRDIRQDVVERIEIRNRWFEASAM
jgi:hypothetical protein